MKIVKPHVKLNWITPNAEQEIERAGRVCYKSEDKITSGTADRFIKSLIEREHYSVLEHAVASITFICDRGVTHEMVRHRMASYSQESTRYCNYGKDKFGGEVSFIEPPQLTPELRDNWIEACLYSEKKYLEMLERGCTPQIARAILPNCLKTEIVMTCNFREWRHVFALRTSQKAHPQIKEVMDMALALLKEKSPTVFGDM